MRGSYNGSSEENILLVEEGEYMSRAQRMKTSDNENSLDNEVTFMNKKKPALANMKRLPIDKIKQNYDMDFDENITNRSILISGKPKLCRGSSRGSIQISAYELYKIKKNEKINQISPD